MKTIISITLILIISAAYSLAEENTEETIKASYGVSTSLINTGTGHGIGYTVNGNITKGRKSLEVGLVYSERESKISGGDFKYRILLGNMDRLQSKSKLYTPYLQYNLLYQKGMSYSPEIVTLGDETYMVESDPGMIATIGHFVSCGNKIRILGNAYIDASLGLGFYTGALDKIDGPGTFGIHNMNNGFTYSFKIGFGYSFN